MDTNVRLKEEVSTDKTDPSVDTLAVRLDPTGVASVTGTHITGPTWQPIDVNWNEQRHLYDQRTIRVLEAELSAKNALLGEQEDAHICLVDELEAEIASKNAQLTAAMDEVADLNKRLSSPSLAAQKAELNFKTHKIQELEDLVSVLRNDIDKLEARPAADHSGEIALAYRELVEELYRKLARYECLAIESSMKEGL